MTTKNLLKAPDRAKLSQTGEVCQCGHLHLLHDIPKSCCYVKGDWPCTCRGFVRREGKAPRPGLNPMSKGATGRKASQARKKALLRLLKGGL